MNDPAPTSTARPAVAAAAPNGLAAEPLDRSAAIAQLTRHATRAREAARR